MNKTTNLDAVKDYIAENGVSNFIFGEWLEMEICDIKHEVRDALDQYDSFQEIFDEVLLNGMGLKWKKRFLEEIGKYLSEEDSKIVENAYARVESIMAKKRMEKIKEFAEQAKGKTILAAYYLDDDSFGVGFNNVTPILEIAEDGYCLKIKSGNANMEIKDADIIHYDGIEKCEDEDEEVEEDGESFNWYGFILNNGTKVLVEIQN